MESSARVGDSVTGPRNPREGSASARSRRTGHNRLTGHRHASRGRTSRRALASGHVKDRSTQRSSTHRQRSSNHRSAHRQSGTQRNRGDTHRNRNTRPRSTHRHRPRQSHRNTGHVSEWSASGTARASSQWSPSGYRSSRTRSQWSPSGYRNSRARRILDAVVAARYQRGSCRVRAQRHGGTTQAGAGNYLDVEPSGGP